MTALAYFFDKSPASYLAMSLLLLSPDDDAIAQSGHEFTCGFSQSSHTLS